MDLQKKSDEDGDSEEEEDEKGKPREKLKPGQLYVKVPKEERSDYHKNLLKLADRLPPMKINIDL